MNIEHEFETHLPFWPHLTADQRALLVSGTSRRSFRAGENVHGRTGDCTGILLVLSGETDRAMVEAADRKPDYILDGVWQIADLLK